MIVLNIEISQHRDYISSSRSTPSWKVRRGHVGLSSEHASELKVLKVRLNLLPSYPKSMDESN